MKRVENITVDVKDDEYSEIKLKQMDTTQLVFKMLDNSQKIPLVDCTADVVFTTPTGRILIQDATVNEEKQEISVDLKPDCVNDYGRAKIEVEVKKNAEVLSSFQFYAKIEKTSKANINSENTPNYIEMMEKAVEELKEQSKTALQEFENLKKQVETVLANITSRGHIYGIKRKITDLKGTVNTSPAWTKIYDNEGLVAEAQKGSSGVARNDYDNIYPWSEIKTINYNTETNKTVAYIGDDNFKFDGTNGEVLTRVPKMWIKRLFPVPEEDGYYEYRMIADFELQDFVEIKQFECGRYEMYVDEQSKAHSYSGVYPKYNANIKSFNQYAKSLGDGYCICDWRRFVIETLYLVEYANNHSQDKLGRGVTEWSDKAALVAENKTNRVIVDNASAFPVGRSISIGTSAAWNGGVASNRTVKSIEEYSENEVSGYAIQFDGEPVNIAIGNHIWGSAQKTGDCDSLGMKSGCLTNDGRHSMIYRGFENVLGNIFEFIGGLNINEYQSYICYDPSKYEPDKYDEEFEKLSYPNPNEVEGYTKIMGYDKNNPLIALPTEIGASSTTGYCDYCYSKNNGQRVARVGGSFNSGTPAGLFYWNFSNTSSHSYWDFGARLLKYQ